MSENQEYNSGHYIEFLDRIHTIQTMLDNLLLDHVAARKYGVNNNLHQISDDLMKVYQETGERMTWDE